jgi:pyridoxamine 5'-phosphate oxidase
VDLAGMRTQYEGAEALEPGDLAADPLTQLGRWLADGVEAGAPSANAMVLSSVDGAGAPQSRYVLLRGLDDRGLRFFTNHRSAKGRELEANPAAAAVFGWPETHRQARVTGRVARVPEAESDAYFASRPRATQIGSWASAQSEVIADREELLGRVAEVERRFAGGRVPRPAHWGGYVLAPEVVELWQGQPNRLHDRLRYRRDPDGGGWVIERLSP